MLPTSRTWWVGQAAGYPYFLQEYGRELWDAAGTSQVTMADLDEVPDLVQEQLARTFCGTRFELASDAEQRYLAAMASAWPPSAPRPTRPPRWPRHGVQRTNAKAHRTLTASSKKASSGHLGGDRSTSAPRSLPSSSFSTTRSAPSTTSEGPSTTVRGPSGPASRAPVPAFGEGTGPPLPR